MIYIFINLSTLTRSGRENESERWQTMQSWLVALRRAEKSVILVHHAGKSGQQRGTSKREDVLDTIVEVRRPQDYVASQGICFELHFQKARQLYGVDAELFQASCEVRNDQALWGRGPISNVRQDAAQRLRHDGMSLRQIAAEMGTSKSTAARLLDEEQAPLL
jgi:putative DNA primase/helicase